MDENDFRDRSGLIGWLQRYRNGTRMPSVAMAPRSRCAARIGLPARQRMSPVRSKALSAIWPAMLKTLAAGRAREAAGTMQNLYSQAKDSARDAGDAAVSYAKDAYDNSGDAFREGSDALARKVQDNPLGALLTAGAIGFALAMLMTRPPRRPPQRWRYYS